MVNLMYIAETKLHTYDKPNVHTRDKTTITTNLLYILMTNLHIHMIT